MSDRLRPLWMGALGLALVVLLGVTAQRVWRRAGSRVSPAEQHYRTGLEFARAGNGPRAVGEWRLAIALAPADPRPYEALAGYYEENGQPDLAAQTLEQLGRVNPSAPHRDCRFSQAAFAAGWVTQAQEAADRAVHSEPDCPLAHTIRGIVLDDAGEPAEALTELARAHQLSPADERITLTLAQVEGRTGRREAAEGRVREVLRRDPASPQAHYLMGWLAANAAPPTPATDAEAVKQLRQVLAQNPDHAPALAELGALYARQGKFARARPLLEKARAQDPNDAALARNLALTAARLGDSRAAPLAAVARRLEEGQQRRRALRREHLRRPADAAVTLQLARLELASGQAQEATDLVRRILRADPDNRGALDLMHQIMESTNGAK